MYMHGSHGHQSLDGGTQEAARKKGSFPSVALNLATVCIMTIKSRCKCRRSSRKPDGCWAGYHVNREDYSFISTGLCGNIGGSVSSKHGSCSPPLARTCRVKLVFSSITATGRLLCFLLSGCLTLALHLSHSHTAAGMFNWGYFQGVCTQPKASPFN